MTGQITGVLAAGAVAVAAAGCGRALIALLGRRWRFPRDAFSRYWLLAVLGLGVLGHILAVAGLAHGYTPGVVRIILAAGVALAGWGLIRYLPHRGHSNTEHTETAEQERVNRKEDPTAEEAKADARRTKSPRRNRTWILWVCRAGAVVALASLIPAVAFPPLAYDTLEYHLEAPRLFLDSGTLTGTAHNFFTRLPVEAELVYGAGDSIKPPNIEDDRAAEWIAVGWVALFAWGCGVIARRLGAGPATRWAAVAVGAALPLAGKVSLDAFSDGATAVFAELMAWGFLGLILSNWRRTPQGARRGRPRPDWLIAGAGAGLAVSCKWGVVPHLVLPAAALLVILGANRTRMLAGMGKALVFGVTALVAFSPWMIRSAWVTGNPVFPWMASVFPSHTWSLQQEQFLIETHHPLKPWQGAYWKKAWVGIRTAAPGFNVPARGGGNEGNGEAANLVLPLGAVLAAIGLFRRRGRRGYLAAFALSVIAVLAWAAVQQAPDRFLLPPAGVFVAATVTTAGAVMRWGGSALRPVRLSAWAAGLLVAGMAFQAVAARTQLYRTGGYFDALADPLVREEAREAVLGRPIVTLQGRATAAMTRDGGRLLILYEARGFLFPLPHSLNTVFDRSILLDSIGDANTPAAIDRALRAKGFTNVVINEFELDRLVRFYPPLDFKGTIPPRDRIAKSPVEPYPLMDLYRPYASDPRYAAKREAIRAWTTEVLKRARWRFAGSNGLTLCLSPIPK